MSYCRPPVGLAGTSSPGYSGALLVLSGGGVRCRRCSGTQWLQRLASLIDHSLRAALSSALLQFPTSSAKNLQLKALPNGTRRGGVCRCCSTQWLFSILLMLLASFISTCTLHAALCTHSAPALSLGADDALLLFSSCLNVSST
jgi:hypothetical protein